MGEDLSLISVEKAPSNPLRMMNHWDNMDGSIERGYSGNSFFYENKADYGGAIRFNGEGTVTNCNFTNNTAGYWGGANCGLCKVHGQRWNKWNSHQ